MPVIPQPANESARMQVLAETGVLDTPREPDFDTLCELAARLCGAPMALLTLVDRDRVWFKARRGCPCAELPRSAALCSLTILQSKPLLISDTANDDRARELDPAPNDPPVRAYAGVPLVTADGFALGTLSVLDTRPREFTAEQAESLEALARQAIAQLELRRQAARLRSAEDQLSAAKRELEHKERELAAARELAASADRMRTQFVANMSHEVRTPMTAILGFAEMLDSPTTTAAQRAEAIATIRRNGERLLSVISDVLDVARLESRRMDVTPAPCNPLATLREVIEQARPAAQAKRLTLTFDASPSLPTCIRTDPARLRQILANLIGNAVKFTDCGSVRVSASAAGSPTGPRLRIEIADTGIGLTPAEQERLFLPFRQSDDSPTRRFGGNGLGLYIARELALQLGGDIAVQSSPGRGSTFTLTVAAPPTDGCRVITAAPRTPPHLRGRILVVEDSPDNQRLISHILTSAGASVTIAPNGREGVNAVHTAAARGTPFHLVIMDMQMPVMDGYDATRSLRASGCSIPIIALTAHAMTDDRARCLAAGCSDYQTKPIDRLNLVSTCQLFISRARAAAA